MKEVRINKGTVENPHILDKSFSADDLVILEGGVYILRNNVRL